MEQHIRNTDSLDSFKKHLKTCLFHQAFSSFINRFLFTDHFSYLYT